MLHYGNVHWCTSSAFPFGITCTIFPLWLAQLFCKVLIMYRIMGEAGGKHVISAM